MPGDLSARHGFNEVMNEKRKLHSRRPSASRKVIAPAMLLLATGALMLPTSASQIPDQRPPDPGAQCFQQLRLHLRQCRLDNCTVVTGCREPSFSACVAGATAVFEHCMHELE